MSDTGRRPIKGAADDRVRRSHDKDRVKRSSSDHIDDAEKFPPPPSKEEKMHRDRHRQSYKDEKFGDRASSHERHRDRDGGRRDRDQDYRNRKEKETRRVRDEGLDGGNEEHRSYYDEDGAKRGRDVSVERSRRFREGSKERERDKRPGDGRDREMSLGLDDGVKKDLHSQVFRESRERSVEKGRDYKDSRERSVEVGDRVKRSHESRDLNSHGGERERERERDGRINKRREREFELEGRKDKDDKRRKFAEDVHDHDERRDKEESRKGEDEVKDDRKKKGEKRKFDARVDYKEEEGGIEQSAVKRRAGEGVCVESSLEVTDAQVRVVAPGNGSASVNGVQQSQKSEASKESSKDLSKPLANTEFSTDPKVSTVFTTNVVENKADNIARSHEVIGKTSTDGTSSTAGKGGNLSLGALARAKEVLQRKKDYLNKLPQLNKFVGTSSVATSSVEPSDTAGAYLKTSVSVTSSAPLAVPTSAAIQSKEIVSSGAAPTTLATAGNMKLQPGTSGLAGVIPGHVNIPNLEAVKRAQELAARLGFHQDPESMPLFNMFPGQISDDFGTAGQPKPAKAPVLRLDAHGREIDEHGNVIDKPKITNLSTLKVNINKQKKEAFQILKPELDEDAVSNPYFDPRMGIDKTKILRPKRMTFQFVEEGKWSKQAEILKIKSQFGEAQAKELKAKQAQLAKAKAEVDINPNLIEVSERIPMKEEKKPKDAIPDVEWWDKVLLSSSNYADVTEGEFKVKMEKITIYVEHPQPIEPPAEPLPPPPQPLKLTKKEQKKLRTQRRLAKEKDRQEMIRQGLIEPPKPKVKMSNLMRVLGSEATQDPTKLEMEIRSAAAEREQAHVDRNIARKLTPAERREKKERKLFDDPSTLETIVSVYKINDLSHPQTRFKVDINAQENRLSGCAVITNGMSVVVVEGGSKSIKRYGKLMLHRINWAAAVVKEEEEEEEEVESCVNKCLLVWQGSVAKASFNKFIIQQCRTEAAARKFFADAGVGHYWDLAVNFSDDQV